MKRCIIALATLAVAWMIMTPHAGAQDKAPQAIYIIFDASGSMWGQLPDKSHKVVVAKSVLQDFVSRDFGQADLALRVYGHRRKGDCRDSELVASFGPSSALVERVKAFMAGLNPLGKTPITYSLRQALEDFGDREGEIILITDGIETCDEDPCALVREWKARDVKINVHVVGLGLEEKEKASLQCISEAAGTVYHDTESAMDLSMELAKIQEQTVQTPDESPGDFEGTRTVGFWLQGIDESGDPIRVVGKLSRDGIERFDVSSNARNQVDAGTYQLVAGVRTANGTLYQPVEQTVTADGNRDTVVKVAVVEPPSVKALFSDAGEAQRGANIRAYQDGTEVFSFRWIDEVYVDEGTYEFRARPNADNDLSISETLAAGDHKELVFEMMHTVHAVFKMIAEGSETRLRGNFELWQDGAMKYKVHTANGATVLPGTYDVHLINPLKPHVEPGVFVKADEARQTIEIMVPVAYVTFVYQKADGSTDGDKRVFVGRGSEKRGRVLRSGTVHALLPGTYNAVGWRGTYDKVVFEVEAGEEKEIVLRDKS